MPAIRTRVMKARRTKGVCPLCDRTILRGEYICKIDGSWRHRDCELARRRNKRGTAT